MQKFENTLWSGKCRSGEMSGRESLRRGSVQSGNCPVGEVSVGEVSTGEVSSGKCQSGKSPVGKLSYNHSEDINDGRHFVVFSLSHQFSVSIFNFNPFMHSFEKWSNIL